MLGSLRASVESALHRVLVVLQLGAPNGMCDVIGTYLGRAGEGNTSFLCPRIKTTCWNQRIHYVPQFMPDDGVCSMQLSICQLVGEPHVADTGFNEGHAKPTRLLEVLVVPEVKSHVEWLTNGVLCLTDA